MIDKEAYKIDYKKKTTLIDEMLLAPYFTVASMTTIRNFKSSQNVLLKVIISQLLDTWCFVDSFFLLAMGMDMECDNELSAPMLKIL